MSNETIIAAKIKMAGLVQGKSNLEIAGQMDISRHTVDAYLRRVFLKIGVSDRTSAAIAAISNDLISEPFNRLVS